MKTATLTGTLPQTGTCSINGEDATATPKPASPPARTPTATPRTNAATRYYDAGDRLNSFDYVDPEEMATLETELAAERKKVRVLREKVRAYVRQGELRRELTALVTPVLAPRRRGGK